MSRQKPLKLKYNVEKRVAEHNRKLRKIAKESHGARRHSKLRQRALGIPLSMPFRNTLLDSIQKSRDYSTSIKLENRQLRLDTYLEQANKVEDTKEMINNKSYMKQARDVLQVSSVILFVLDARDPQACRNIDLENEATSSGKKVIFILNKVDLVPVEHAQIWAEYLKKFYPVIPFKAARQHVENISSFSHSLKPDFEHENALGARQTIVGAEQLMGLLKNYQRSGAEGVQTVGILGYPNVGKSSVINTIARKKHVEIGGQPGVTKTLRFIKVDSSLRLVDSPGVLYDSCAHEADNLSVAIIRCALQIEKLTDPLPAIEALCACTPADQLQEAFSVPSFSSAEDFLVQVGLNRGFLKKGGVTDIVAAGKHVLRDIQSGVVSYPLRSPPLESH